MDSHCFCWVKAEGFFQEGSSKSQHKPIGKRGKCPQEVDWPFPLFCALLCLQDLLQGLYLSKEAPLGKHIKKGGKGKVGGGTDDNTPYLVKI